MLGVRSEGNFKADMIFELLGGVCDSIFSNIFRINFNLGPRLNPKAPRVSYP